MKFLKAHPNRNKNNMKSIKKILNKSNEKKKCWKNINIFENRLELENSGLLINVINFEHRRILV